MLCGKWGRERRREAERQNNLWSQNDTSSLLSVDKPCSSWAYTIQHTLRTTKWEQRDLLRSSGLHHHTDPLPTHSLYLPQDPEALSCHSPPPQSERGAHLPGYRSCDDRPDAAFRDLTSQGRETNTKHRHYEGDRFKSWKCRAGNRKQDNRQRGQLWWGSSDEKRPSPQRGYL